MKRTFLTDIEKQISSQWDMNNREYHRPHVNLSKPKFFATFPYPYMNGKLHLGHAFTMCKVDFTCRFKRLMGYNVLFPFGFHCTGMPICAAAKKLENELETIKHIQTNTNEKLQYNILKYYKLTDDEIIGFTNPLKWVNYFSQEGLNDIKSFGLMTDLSRSFITTNQNPFYDSFISYQFEKLHSIGLLKYGTRNSIYSPNLNIQCQDHDRSVGEGVGIEEYVIKTLENKNELKSKFIFVIKKSSIQTNETQETQETQEIQEYNILLNPKSQFVKFKYNDIEYYCSKYIYKNIWEQNILGFDNPGQYRTICQDLSDPEILANIFEQIKLVDKISLSETIKSTSFNSIQMFELVGFGVKPVNLTNSTNDNKVVKTADNIVIFEKSQIYLTDDIVIDRTGKECVVKPLPQWYINYANPEWKEKTIRLVETHMNSNPDITKTLISNINKLHEWGVSRQFGLGTRLPCDTNELIDSLSDSTIYPAYYTIANFIQSNIFGQSLNNIKSSDFTYNVWDYIFSNTDVEPELGDNSSVNIELLNKMRESFNYWYPVDLRISGKDLMTNHLVMYLFNHSACFKEKYFPRTIFANGWILIDGVKMSKSNGNFITIGELNGEIPCDSIRMTLADSGDDLTDANFVRSNASDNNLLKIYDWVKHMEELCEPDKISGYRTGSNTFELIDKLFVKLIDKQIRMVIKHYNELRFRDVLIEGFFNFNGLREKYKIYCGILGLDLHKDLVDMFCISQTILINPIIPHSTEYVWVNILNSTDLIYNSDLSFILGKKWIDEIENPISEKTTNIIGDWECLMDLVKQVQSALTKNSKKKTWICNKIILKCKLTEISQDFVINLFTKVLGYPIEISDLDRPRPYFIFELN